MTNYEVDHRLTVALYEAGISVEHGIALRKISRGLRKWYENECNGLIERSEDTGKPFWRNPFSGLLIPYRDNESALRKRLDEIMVNYPDIDYYIQADPRGCALYIIRPGDVPEGERPESYYTRGIAVV